MALLRNNLKSIWLINIVILLLVTQKIFAADGGDQDSKSISLQDMVAPCDHIKNGVSTSQFQGGITISQSFMETTVSFESCHWSYLTSREKVQQALNELIGTDFSPNFTVEVRSDGSALVVVYCWLSNELLVSISLFCMFLLLALLCVKSVP